MPDHRGDGDKFGHKPINEDELLAGFDSVPTVQASIKKTNPAEVRRAMLALAEQAIALGASKDELAEAVRAIDPKAWGTVKNKNRLYR
jgi:hypothetical protein